MVLYFCNLEFLFYSIWLNNNNNNNNNFYFIFLVCLNYLCLLCYIWFPENAKKRKKNVKKNNFFMFYYLMKNIKENKI